MFFVIIFSLLVVIILMIGSSSNSKDIQRLANSVDQQIAETGKVDTVTTIGLIGTFISAVLYL